jgi:hypothetical protein
MYSHPSVLSQLEGFLYQFGFVHSRHGVHCSGFRPTKPSIHDLAKILDYYLSNVERSRKLTEEFVLRYFNVTLLDCQQKRQCTLIQSLTSWTVSPEHFTAYRLKNNTRQGYTGSHHAQPLHQ